MSLALVLRALALLPIDVAFHVHWILSLPYFPVALKFYRGCWLYGFIARDKVDYHRSFVVSYVVHIFA